MQRGTENLLDPSQETTLDSSQETPFDPRPLAAESSDGQAVDEPVGRRIGPYRIERLIARGGMGRVYLAVREDDYEQEVALKLVDRETDRIETLRRFLEERQILARLEHPNIARILDGGTTTDGLPFFVMELIDGEPVDRYCERHASSLKERLRLFQEICQVVHFAHQNLIVHRDLKPSNILVTTEGVPKLVDFGIAALLVGDSAACGKGNPLTPAYAAPEQFLEGPVTTATDIYSLGVLLYRLIAGRHPHRGEIGAGQPGKGRIPSVLAADPPPPSEVVGRTRAHPISARSLEGDLDAVVRKAMQVRPTDRYDSALQLAGDLRRHLEDQVLEAHPGTWSLRLRKRARRHRWALAVFSGLFAFAVVVSGLWRHAVQEELVARQARNEAEVARGQSEAALLRADRVTGVLENLFRSADPDAGDLSVHEVLDRGRRNLAIELREEPEVLADLLGILGSVYNNLSLYEEALELKQEALWSRLDADRSDRHDLAVDLNNLGRLLYDLGDYAGAADHYERALSMWQRLGDEAHANLVLGNLAKVFTLTGRSDRALELHTEILEQQSRDLEKHRAEVGVTLQSLGVLYRARGEPEEAERVLRQALDLFGQEFGPRHTRIASVLSTLGRALQDQGRHDEAREKLEKVLAMRRELYGEDHLKIATARKNLAAVLLAQGEVAAAGEHLEASLRILRERNAADWVVANTESLWGGYLAAIGRRAEAESVMLAALEVIRTAKGSEDIDTVAARERVRGLQESQGPDSMAGPSGSASTEPVSDAP